MFSKNSNQSKQVAKEIQIAIDNEVVVIPIRVDNVEMNDVLTYYLSTMHWILEYDEKTLLDRVEKALLEPKATKHKQNLDVFLHEKIDEYFLNDDASSVFDKETGQELLKKKISSKHIDKLIDNLAEISEKKEDKQVYLQKQGKHFSLVDNEEQVTIAFKVMPVLDESKKMFINSYLEELESTEEPLSDGRVERTFFIDYLHYYDMPVCTKLVLLTFCPKEHCLYINNGFCENDKVCISKYPQVEFWDDDHNRTIPDCNYIIDGKNAFIEYSADSQTDIIIISLETFKVIKSKKQFDSRIGDWKTTIKLDVEKPYFVIKTQSNTTVVDEIIIALGYLHGLWGLPHNILKAIDLLEKDGSAKAKYILAKIFKNDDMLME